MATIKSRKPRSSAELGTSGSGKHKKWPTDSTGKNKDNSFNGLTKDVEELVQSLNLPAMSAKAAVVEHNGSTKKSSKARKDSKSSTKIKPDISPDRPKKHIPKKLQGSNQGHKKEHQQNQDTQKETAVKRPSTITTAGKARFIVEPSPQWYLSSPTLSPKTSLPTPSTEFLSKMSDKAVKLLDKEAAEALAHPTSGASGSSDARFLSQILASGTLSDRLSALTLMAQASPLHNQKALETLRGMASKKSRDESLKALRAIVDWWVGGGSPDRKLKYFRDQPITHPDVTDQHLVIWAFEDWLKKYFFKILQQLENLSLDPLPYVRTQTLTFLYALLKDKPEQEQNLLRLLVNKLGDTEKSVSSKVSYLLLQLLQNHPSMKAVVVREVTSLVLHPRATNTEDSAISSSHEHARYYGVLTFTQTTLTHSEKDVAELLVTVYFELFTTILQGSSADQGEDGKETVAPDSKADDQVVDPKKQLGRKSKKSGKKAQSHQQPKGKETGFAEVEDGDSKIISAILTGINRALPFARAEDSIFDNHIETLFRITHTATFNVSIQALVLILQVANSRKSILDRFYRALYESILDPRLCDSSKQAMYLNLFFKAVKLDKSIPRVCAFVKRLLQALGMHQPSFICGALFLLGELFEITPNLRQHMSTILKSPEHAEGESSEKIYDPKKREPLFAYADDEPFWEIVPLMNHYHPSVSLHAHQLLKGEAITTTADLSLNSISSFLDRFVYKNPKKLKPRGASAMQPGTGAANDGTTILRVLKGGEIGTVNEEAFWKKDAKDVPVDQLFFHKFFTLKQGTEQAKTEKRNRRKEGKEKGSSAGSDSEHSQGSDSDADEAEIWKAMKKSMPGPMPDGDMTGDDDSIPDGLDETDSDSSDDGSMSDAAKSGEDSDNEEIPFGMEDEDDLMDLPETFPDELLKFDGDDEESDGSDEDASEDEEWGGVNDAPKRKMKVGKEKERKRRKVAKLPTFASAEDYAKLIDAEPEDNI